MSMINGPLLSTIICGICAVGVFLNDAVHATFPLLQSRKYHASMLLNLFGPLVSIDKMDKLHGWATSIMLLVIIGGIWQKSEVLSLVTTTILATLQPYYLLVALYLKLCKLPNPLHQVVYSAVFGIFGLLWREMAASTSNLNKTDIPMITLWHFCLSLLVLFSFYRMKSNLPKIRANLELEKLKADSLARGECSWPDVYSMPEFQEGFEPYPILVETAETEQENLVPTRFKTIVSAVFLFSALFVLGITQTRNYGDAMSDAIITLCLMGVTLPLVLVELAMTVFYMRMQDKEERNLFDNIEGSRSYDSEQ